MKFGMSRRIFAAMLAVLFIIAILVFVVNQYTATPHPPAPSPRSTEEKGRHKSESNFTPIDTAHLTSQCQTIHGERIAVG